jgi:hypothetical protein
VLLQNWTDQIFEIAAGVKTHNWGKRYFKWRFSFLLDNCEEEILEIALGVSITKQWTTYILNCGRKFFAIVRVQLF